MDECKLCMHKRFNRLDSAPIAVPAEKAGQSITLGSLIDRENRLCVNYKKRNKEKRDDEYLKGRKISKGKRKLGRKKSQLFYKKKSHFHFSNITISGNFII